jgi:aldehyde:ferredoxin oxidoreductase
MHLNDLCDSLGMDTISAGNLVAFAMELSARNILPEKISYGDTSAAEALIKQIAHKQGIGEILALGIVQAAKHFGAEELAVHVKGLEPAGYDPRVLKGMGLAYGISDRGACHLRTTFYKAELSGMVEKDSIEGKAVAFIDFEDRATLFDSLILCRFFRDLYTWEQLSRIISMTTGMDHDQPSLAAIAGHIADEARRYNVCMGLTIEDDSLPIRFHQEPLPPSGSVLKEADYKKMRADYYRLRGWDEAGAPHG